MKPKRIQKTTQIPEMYCFGTGIYYFKTLPVVANLPTAVLPFPLGELEVITPRKLRRASSGYIPIVKK
jgi:hypothetical protein